MTPEQFIWWLEGFLDGGADINMDVRDQLREKLEQVGAPAAQKQPTADRPRTPADASRRYIEGIGVGVATPGVASPMVGSWHSGGLASSEPMLMMTNAAVTSVAAALTPSTSCVNAEMRA